MAAGIFLALLSIFLPLDSRALELTFVAGSAEHEAAALQYRAIWEQDGDRIVQALEQTTGVALDENQIGVIVREQTSSSGIGSQPMNLRASYPEAIKRGTLVHELAHRYEAKLRPSTDLTVHQRLNLLLIPVWEGLWGREFVDAQVQAESKWTKEYQRSWAWAMSLSEDERKHELDRLRAR